ncbi:cas scaffolding protein family member 4 [Electrophorus electricus]|uniref:cas scaffolding protein family member 4 n=1 Tax=Electrophorus electricus TaxID=8005 RepID=UPI0015D04A7B|nr:cas scaffolding protein family member 4 [Electrophorus electricus]
METLYAKALYDNVAESPDELAFCKGDVLAVLQQTVPRNVGWWRCSLLGKEGLVPANRLCLLPAETSVHAGAQGIYQTPGAPRTLAASPTYEVMERICNEHTTPVKQRLADIQRKTQNIQVVLQGSRSPRKMFHAKSSPKLDVYDVPNLMKRGSWATQMPSPRTSAQKPTTMSAVPQGRYEVMASCRPSQTIGSAVPPSVLQDPNYDIKAPSIGEFHQAVASGSSTLPSSLKPEWIYDVPLASNKACGSPGYLGASSSLDKQHAGTLLAYLSPTSPSMLYDVPKSNVTMQQGTDHIYDVPPAARLRKPSLDAAALGQRRSLDNSDRAVEPLEYRGKSGPVYDLPRGRPPWGIRPSVECEVEKARGMPVSSSQRSSMASTSSSASSSSRSSCDSLMLSSPSPEPLREIMLSQEEVAQRLLQLQGAVFRAVPALMDFVSSNWRCREHLSQHLQEIRSAAEAVANSVSGFLDFALDLRGNARRLTDSNLQARLQKQLSIVEDSGLILQQAVDTLGGLGWPLEDLAQDPAQSQAPDQLERFVMVARTVPEDVKRLVSILNANGKLLFRNTSKEQESVKDTSPADTVTSAGKKEPPADDNDYVQLQTKTEFEEQRQTKGKNEKKTDANMENEKKQVPKPQPGSPASKSQTAGRSSSTDHCRLYFGALKKAIAVFLSSLDQGHLPEKFIGHSKLVIMVGQRLIDSLCSEVQGRPHSQDILCKSSQLCALLKQLAVATKKAALHFPDKVAIQEVQDFAKELFVWVQQFRSTLDI